MFKKEKKKELTPQEVFATTAKDRNSSLLAGMSVDKTARAVTKMVLLRKIFLTAIGVFILLMGTVFVATAFYTGSSGFTVRAAQAGDTGKSISLSETQGFTNGTVFLKGPTNPAMDNITYKDLPLKKLESKDGDHSGKNYLGYTFYLKNSGEKALDYKYSLNYPRATLGIEKAVRVMLIKNGKAVIYAAPTNDGQVERFPEGIKNFIGASKITEGQHRNIKPGGVDRYTVIVWLEGEDPECVDAVRSGTMALEMNFKVIE